MTPVDLTGDILRLYWRSSVAALVKDIEKDHFMEYLFLFGSDSLLIHLQIIIKRVIEGVNKPLPSRHLMTSLDALALIGDNLNPIPQQVN